MAPPTPTDLSRPYLERRPSPGRPNPPDNAGPDLSKVLASTVPISWKTLLSLLNQEQEDELFRDARRARQTPAQARARETVALEEAVHLHVQSMDSAELETTVEPPQNMFAPFTI